MDFQEFQATINPHFGTDKDPTPEDIDRATQAAWEQSGAFKRAKQANGKHESLPAEWRAHAATAKTIAAQKPID